MKKLIIVISAIIIVAGTTTTVKAQPNKATANVLANIVSAISLSKTQELNFGTMTSPTSDVDVTLTTSNSISADAAKILNFPNSYNNASFKVIGEKSYTYTITLPANNTVTITKSSQNPMKVENFLALPASASGTGLNGTLNAMGEDSFYVGATLQVLAGQPIGAYTGTFDVLVAYN